jgi:hypothetical protein
MKTFYANDDNVRLSVRPRDNFRQTLATLHEIHGIRFIDHPSQFNVQCLTIYLIPWFVYSFCIQTRQDLRL